MSRQICPWTGQPWTDEESRAIAARERGYTGWLDQDGRAVASRTDPATGSALAMTVPGSMGHGTPDETRAARLPGK
jgi:hypothetical protein